MTVILLRINLDIENKTLKDNLRFKTAATSIKSLSKEDNIIVILSHLGRPKGFDKKLSLKRFQRPLEKRLKKRVIFINNFNFSSIRKQINQVPGGSIILLENLRFLSGETKNSIKLSRDLASLGTKFINDDFATSHRANVSNVGITKFLPSLPGPLLKEEVKKLSKALKKPKRPFIVVVGGAKIADKIGVINNLLPKADYVLLGGGPANTFLAAKGENISESIYDKESVKYVKKLMKNKKIIMPVDYRRKGNKILDIGPQTEKLYSALIKKARTIVWGGPMGYFENPKFASGSYTIAKAIANSKGYSITGGGETGEIITQLKLSKKINFASTGGGAMLDFLAGKKLPALTALNIFDIASQKK